MQTYLKKHKMLCARVCAFQVLAFTMNALIQLLLMQMFNAATRLDFAAAGLWGAADLTGWALYLLFSVLADRSQAKAVLALNNSVRTDICASLLAKSHSEYHEKDVGEYLSWLTNDIKQLEQLAWAPFFGCVGRVAQVAASVISLAFLHWSLVVYALLSALVMWLTPKLFDQKMQQLGRACSAQQAAATDRLKDVLAGRDVLKSFGREQRFRAQTAAISNAIEQPNCTLNASKATMEGVVGFVNVALQMSSMLWIVFLALRGAVGLGVLVGGVNLIGGVSNGLSELANLRLSLTAAKPYFEKLPTQPQRAPQGPQKPLPAFAYALRVEDVSFSYGEKPILSHASFRFEKGKKYALTGPSGCGKSTLLKLLLGWLPDYAGHIYFDDADLRTIAPEQLQQQMSYIEQNVFLFNTTIRENITLGESFTDAQLKKAIRDSALAGDLAAMPQGLDTIVGEEGGSISGGQKQRIAIARALIHDRSILLVDEGTSALDAQNAALVEKALLANPALTLILISHHLAPERKRQFDAVYELGC